MTSDTTARTSSTIEKRAERQARHARVLRSSMDRHDVSQAEVAHLAGVAPSKVARWVDPDSLERPAAHELEALPDAVAVDLVREVMFVHGYTLAQLPAGAREGDDAQVLAGAIKESGELVAASATLLSRAGVAPSRDVLQRVRREAFEAMEAAAALVARVEAQLAELDRVPRVVTPLTPRKTTAG